MAYATWSVVFGEQPSAAKWNILGTNDADANSRLNTIESNTYPPTGSILAFGSASAPSGWLNCDGTAINRVTYAALFTAISTNYGIGDGSSTFNLPDLRGRIPVGKNSATFATLGATGGTETHTLTTAQIPSHTHTFSDTTSSDSHSHTIANNVIKTGSATSGLELGGIDDATWGTSSTSSDAHTHTVSGTTGSAGSGSSHPILNPYQVINYIIRT